MSLNYENFLLKFRSVMKNAIKILFGIGLIAAGVLWILSVLDVITFSIFFPGWWALFI